MKYSSDFVARVKTAYPNEPDIHEALDKGNDSLGYYLDDSRWLSMSPAQIIEAFEQGRQQDVLEAAKQAVERIKIYEEWNDLYRTNCGQK